MDYILFGDIFTNIEQYLFPINLHNLLQTCKKYNKMITKTVIEKNTINEIKRRLKNILKQNYEEFGQIMQQTNAIIEGPFISECLVGEIWNTKILVYTKENFGLVNGIYKNTDTNTDINTDTDTDTDTDPNVAVKNNQGIYEFMINKGYIQKKGSRFTRTYQYRYIPTIHCRIDKINVIIMSLYGLGVEYDDFMNTHMEYNFTINTYSFLADKLCINSMRENFSKITNISKFINLHRDFFNVYKKGFKFYKTVTDHQLSSTYKFLMTNYDIMYSFFNIIKIEENGKEEMDGIFILQNDVLYSQKQYFVFNIIETSYRDKSKIMPHKVNIDKCESSAKCVIKLMYPKIIHYHGTFIEDNNDTAPNLNQYQDPYVYNDTNKVILMIENQL